MRQPRQGFCCGALLAGFLLVTARPGGADDRSTILLRYACSNDLGRRDVTLFLNGTVRLREGLWQQQDMYLDELGPEEVAEQIRGLRELVAGTTQLDDRVDLPHPVSGAWIETCELQLALPEAKPVHVRFSRYDVPPAEVTRLVQFAEELADHTRPLLRVERLPPSYKPRRGDVLRTEEGERFRVVGLTADERGVELEALDQPIRIFVSLGEIGEAFARLEETARP